MTAPVLSDGEPYQGVVAVVDESAVNVTPAGSARYPADATDTIVTQPEPTTD